jgi:DNA polymerase
VQSLLGPNITIASAKNKVYESPFGPIVVTRHPSSVLRMKEHDERQQALNELVGDLRRAAALIKKP